MHDFGKPWWGVAYVPCMTNLRALYAWVTQWHVTCMLSLAEHWQGRRALSNRKWQDYVYIQCEYKSTKQKIKHLLREENKVKENKIS